MARMYEERGRGRWRVSYRVAGKRRTKCFTDQARAEEFMRQVRTEGAAPEPGGEPANEHTWCHALDEARERIMGAVRDGSADVLQAGRVLSSLAMSRSKYQNLVELEREMIALRRAVNTILNERPDERPRSLAQRIGQGVTLAPGPAGPSEPDGN